jgi:16S rRNA (guanine966-N2)-methyltransferase
MRIVAGEFRGRAIAAPKGLATRPTTDRVRESLFSVIGSIMGPGLASCTVLDAFAGSGALGLEALSRGADHAVFAEKDRSALAALSGNIGVLGVEARAKVLKADVFSLARRGVPGGPFALILLDPPYTLDAVKVGALLGDLARTNGLAPGALCSWEHASGSDAAWPEGFELMQRKRYGTTEIEFAVYETEAGGS